MSFGTLAGSWRLGVESPAGKTCLLAVRICRLICDFPRGQVWPLVPWRGGCAPPMRGMEGKGEGMKTLPLSEALYGYLLKNTLKVSPVLDELAVETSRLPDSGMQISPDQGAFMHLLVKLLGARNVLEVGCFTGYSAIAMASALPDTGRLVTLDRNEETTTMARKFFRKAGVEQRITVMLGRALDSLEQLCAAGEEGAFDLMFIDADKETLPKYYEWGLRLVRSGGVILIDNVLWGGDVIDPRDQSLDTRTIRALNEVLQSDVRVEATMLHMADGLYLVRKK